MIVKMNTLINNLIALILLSILLTGCGSVGMAVVGTSLGIAGNRGMSYYDSGEVDSVLYTDPETIEQAVVYAFEKYNYILDSKYLLSNGIIGYTGQNNSENPEAVVNIEIELEELAENVTEITITAREGIFTPKKGICHLLLNEITEFTIRHKQQMQANNGQN